jgi:nitroimidazol reductase NimA-like FMN-containing flavoprotein (pyridoxamine 5'-phosphate oxidase superfamily)
MDPALTKEITSILDDANDRTIATVRHDGYPQATTVSYVNDSLVIYFGCAAQSQKAKNMPATPRSRSPSTCLTLAVLLGWTRRSGVVG